MKELFGIEVNVKEINKKIQVDKQIKQILESHNKIRRGWKIEIGTFIAEKWDTNKIDREIKGVFENIKSQTEM